MSDAEEVKISMKVMINKEKTEVLFAECNGDFVDILLSFLTLPLGRIVNVLEKHYGAKETPVIGCINNLYNTIANLDRSHFWTKGTKKILLNPTSSFNEDCGGLKLNISDYQPEYLLCMRCSKLRFISVSANQYAFCKCGVVIKTYDHEPKLSQADRSSGVFAINTTTFIVTDDLQIVPDEKGVVQTVSLLNIAGTKGAELVDVTFGLNEIMNLLRASMISETPLSDVLLSTTRHVRESEFETTLTRIEKEENPGSKKMILKVTLQKSTNRVLFAQATKEFIEFLFSLLVIPLGGVEWLLASKSSIKSIDNLYKSISNFIDDKHFKSPEAKNRLIKPKIPHVYISKNQILPLDEEILPYHYQDDSMFSRIAFPQGHGNYIIGSRTYQVMDDLTVMPFCISSILCSLNEQMISLADLKEVEIEIGLEEALSILKASITSNSALTNGLLNRISRKQPICIPWVNVLLWINVLMVTTWALSIL